jgi:membrane-bound lytic murein transglycosylase D
VAKEPLALAYLKNPGAYPPAGYQNYAAQEGDTWWAIARRTGIPVAELRQFNASLPETLSGGQAVRVPASASGSESTALAEADACTPVRQAAAKPLRHRVNRGETLASIARKYNVPVSELSAANHKRSASSRLATGSWVVIPGSPAQAAAPARNTTPTSLAEASDTRHTVRRGESVGSIAAKYGLSSEELLAANHLRSARELKAGHTLVIPGRKPAGKTPGRTAPEPALFASAAPTPAGGSYVVRPGDTLSSISQAHGLDMHQLMAANHLRSGDIRVGDKLVIPGGKAQPAAVPQAALPAPRETAARSGTRPPVPFRYASTAPVAVVSAKPQPEKPAAKAVAAKPAKPAGKAVNYKVNPGETVWGIAKKFNVEPSSLMAWNNMKSPSNLQAGTQITIFKE